MSDGKADMPTDAEIRAIRSRAEASTTGPFELVKRGFGDYDIDPVNGGDIRGVRGQFARREDAEFFALAREDVLRLLSALDTDR